MAKFTECHQIGKNTYEVVIEHCVFADDYQVFLNGVMGFRTDNRVALDKHLATLHPPGNFRYPTSILWGADFAHGFKYVTAENARHAELLIFRKTNGAVTRNNIQIKTEDGTFRFTTPEDYNV